MNDKALILITYFFIMESSLRTASPDFSQPRLAALTANFGYARAEHQCRPLQPELPKGGTSINVPCKQRANIGGDQNS